MPFSWIFLDDPTELLVTNVVIRGDVLCVLPTAGLRYLLRYLWYLDIFSLLKIHDHHVKKAFSQGYIICIHVPYLSIFYYRRVHDMMSPIMAARATPTLFRKVTWALIPLVPRRVSIRTRTIAEDLALDWRWVKHFFWDRASASGETKLWLIVIDWNSFIWFDMLFGNSSKSCSPSLESHNWWTLQMICRVLGCWGVRLLLSMGDQKNTHTCTIPAYWLCWSRQCWVGFSTIICLKN